MIETVTAELYDIFGDEFTEIEELRMICHTECSVPNYCRIERLGRELPGLLLFAKTVIHQDTGYDADGSPIVRRRPKLAEGFNSTKYDGRLKIVCIPQSAAT
jgi:hypothetical protein